MKYVLIIPDGAADHPLPELGNKTAFEAANIPNIDRLSIEGRQGTAATTPVGMPCGSDVCCMSVLGYDPAKYHKGRAPLEAAALGIELDPVDWIFRVNFVTVEDGKMADHSAGAISDEEGQALLLEYAKNVEASGSFGGMTLYPGVSYRNILVDSSGRDYSQLKTTPPHDVPGEPMRDHLPKGLTTGGGEHAELLQQMIAESEVMFADHEVNVARRKAGKKPATHLWPWGQGKRPDMPSFESRFGIKAAMITAVDLLAGISVFIEWDRLPVPGQTSYHDTDYIAAGEHAIKALDDYDLVCVHIEAPDEASHAAQAKIKVAAIEAIDEHVVGPIHRALEQRQASKGEDWRVLLLPDHYTAVSTRKHDPTPVPFALCGHNVNAVLKKPYCEANANESDLHIEHGHELMEYFLKSGL